MKQCPKCSGSIRRMGHIEKPFYCPECKEWFSNEEVTPKLTNADRIRSMTDEELAEFFVEAYWHVCKSEEDIPIDPETEECMGSCKQCYLDWLKQEAEI